MRSQSWAPIAATGQTVFRYLGMNEVYSPVCVCVCVCGGGVLAAHLGE